MRSHGFAALRRLVDSKASEPERCDLCDVIIGEQHQHLVDPENRRMLCACDACAILFNDNGQTKYRRVPRDSWLLDDFEINEQAWSALGIPAGLVFFLKSSAQSRVVAFYPSPAGPAEVDIDPELWTELIGGCSRLQNLMPDVEALLLNRVNGAHDYFIVPVDKCYMLTGLVRKHWQGFSGGEETRQALTSFFEGLRQRSYRLGVSTCAGS